MNNIDKLREKVSSLPDNPGVYIFKDAAGRIIYIGKAKSLKKRVSSYFGSACGGNRVFSAKAQVLAAKVEDIDYILSLSEIQAQLLEASLIKDKQPYYNVSLKDDKSFPLIRISTDEFPVISICRRKKIIAGDKSLYFGPYTNSAFLRQAFKVTRGIFGFRSCPKMPKHPCLYFRLKLCPAPCIGNINWREYKKLINQIILFLESKYEKLIDSFMAKMRIAAKEKNFEEAAKIRDQINALNIFGRGGEYVKGLDDMKSLKNLLNIDKLPERIEAFDISNISGKEAAGSMVSFYKGLPDKNNYRRFRVKTVARINDYAMLREVVRRRYTRIKEENLALPDLVIIDGGKSHLEAAQDEIKRIGFNIPLMSIAKEKENIYIAGRPLPVRLKSNTPALNLIRRIRDEAHRFALAYHHLLRRKKVLGK